MHIGETAPLLGEGRSQQLKHSVLEQAETTTTVHTWSKRQLLGGIAVTLLCSVLWIAYGVIAPFYPTEAVKKGASQTEVGLIFGVYQLVLFIGSPIYGNYMHRLGAVRTFLAGSFLLGGCSILFGFLDECPDGAVFVAMCFIIRCISGNGAAMNTTAGYTIMAKLFPHDVGKAMGLLETASGAALALGPSIGGGLYAVGGYRLPFVVIGAFVLAVTLICYFLLPNLDDASRTEGNMLQLMKIPGCVITYVIIVVTFFAYAFLEPTFSPFLQKEFRFLTIGQIGLIFTILPACYSLSAIFAGWASDKGWIATSTICGLMVSGCSCLLLGPSPLFKNMIPRTLAGVCLSLALFGSTVGLAVVPVFPHILSLTRNAGFPNNLQTFGLMSGLFNSGVSLGGFLGPTISGYLIDLHGFPFGVSMCGAMIILAGLITSIYVLIMYLCGNWPIPVPEEESE